MDCNTECQSVAILFITHFYIIHFSEYIFSFKCLDLECPVFRIQKALLLVVYCICEYWRDNKISIRIAHFSDLGKQR
jgi:hypothetical protein